VKVKSTLDSQLLGVLPSDRIPKATKDANVYFFTHSSNFSKLYQQIPVTFETTSYICTRSWSPYTFTHL